MEHLVTTQCHKWGGGNYYLFSDKHFIDIISKKKLKIPKIFRLLWTKIFGHPQQSKKWVKQL